MYDILEEVFFKIILRLPECLIPSEILKKYLEKRIKQLEQQKIKANWLKIDLERQADKIKRQSQQKPV